ncbi:microsomal triglyceride transfer protein large subunit-like [Pollicipes pollicipes]|uniref:microsomal triglyceride transfer protein large subunit-like n=1 Tax=Pollicipes pollicipes TaxID=41117 RepID=UPI001884A60B|nr:microsomal triglyceride transfer protein large subunit-like [Pollicipes pollicipes]
MLALLDAAGAAQTMAVHKAVRQTLSWRTSGSIERQERYLVALSVGAHPPRELVQDMIRESGKTHPSDSLHESILLTSAALAATLCHHTAGSEQVCDQLSGQLVSALDECEDESCCLAHLRALRNLRSEAALPALLKQALEGEEAACRAEALRALAALPAEVTGRLRPQLERLYAETDRYDPSSRLLAADLLLATPRPGDVTHLLRDLRDRNVSEVNAYVLQRLSAAAERNDELRGALRHLLADSRISNYDVLSQGALSSVLERSLFRAGDVSAGFSSELEVGRSRALRRSAFRAQLAAGGDQLDVLTFSVQAGGLSGMLGSPEPDDAADAFARLELGLLGRQLRPRRLFDSQGELMGLLWSGTGSERTSALRGTALLHDHLQRVPLQNGLGAELSVLGAVTFDFAGQAEVSIWNRNAHAVIDDRGAVLLRGLATVDTPFVRCADGGEPGAGGAPRRHHRRRLLGRTQDVRAHLTGAAGAQGGGAQAGARARQPTPTPPRAPARPPLGRRHVRSEPAERRQLPADVRRRRQLGPPLSG